MSIKAKAPKEDAETAARREAAEERADSARISATQDVLRSETRDINRKFGTRRDGGALPSFGRFPGFGGRGVPGFNVGRDIFR